MLLTYKTDGHVLSNLFPFIAIIINKKNLEFLLVYVFLDIMYESNFIFFYCGPLCFIHIRVFAFAQKPSIHNSPSSLAIFPSHSISTYHFVPVIFISFIVPPPISTYLHLITYHLIKALKALSQKSPGGCRNTPPWTYLTCILGGFLKDCLTTKDREN